MKTIKLLRYFTRKFSALLFVLLISINLNAQILDKVEGNPDKPETQVTEVVYWNVKAYSPDAQLLRIKAIDKDGKIHDIKAIQDSYDTSVLNVKALVSGKVLPIKLIVRGNEPFYSVKAIDLDGTLIDVKAFAPRGDVLDIKGVKRTGNVINLRAITKDGVFYTIVAVSPAGEVNYVKGLKMLDSDVEAIISGVSVFAHVKALKQ